MKVEVKVMLPSGAKIEVTKEQFDNISSYIEGMLLNNKQTFAKKVLGSRRWEQSEISRMMEVLEHENNQNGYSRRKAILELAREFGRTPASIHAKSWKIYQQKSNPINKTF